MSNRTVGALAAAITFTAIAYAAFAFGAWEINPAHWDAVLRSMFAALVSLILVFSIIAWANA